MWLSSHLTRLLSPSRPTCFPCSDPSRKKLVRADQRMSRTFFSFLKATSRNGVSKNSSRWQRSALYSTRFPISSLRTPTLHVTRERRPRDRWRIFARKTMPGIKRRSLSTKISSRTTKNSPHCSQKYWKSTLTKILRDFTSLSNLFYTIHFYSTLTRWGFGVLGFWGFGARTRPNA